MSSTRRRPGRQSASLSHFGAPDGTRLFSPPERRHEAGQDPDPEALPGGGRLPLAPTAGSVQGVERRGRGPGSPHGPGGDPVAAGSRAADGQRGLTLAPGAPAARAEGSCWPTNGLPGGAAHGAEGQREAALSPEHQGLAASPRPRLPFKGHPSLRSTGPGPGPGPRRRVWLQGLGRGG